MKIGTLLRLLVAGALLLAPVKASAQPLTETTWGVDRSTPTAAPICLMQGGSCLVQIGVANLSTGAWALPGALPIANLPAFSGGDCTSSAGSIILSCTKLNGISPGALFSLSPGTGVATALANPVNDLTPGQYGVLTGALIGTVGATIPLLNAPATWVYSPPANTTAWVFQRTSAFTGGISGYETASVTAITQTSASDANYEDAFLAILNNYSTASTLSENTAGHFQANSYADGGIWALALENDDRTGNANPTAPHIGIENTFRVNGTDANGERVIYDAVCTRWGGTGAGAVCSYGLRIATLSPDYAAGGSISTGISFGAPYEPTQFVNGIDFTYGYYSSSAIQLPQGAQINFGGGATRSITYSTSYLRYSNGSINLFEIDDSGNGTLYGNVVAAQLKTTSVASWAAPSNCGSLTSSTECFVVLDPNGNKMYIPAYGTY
jgi:hypothetical protein